MTNKKILPNYQTRPGQSLEDKGLSSANLQTALQQQPATTSQSGNDKKK